MIGAIVAPESQHRASNASICAMTPDLAQTRWTRLMRRNTLGKVAHRPALTGSWIAEVGKRGHGMANQDGSRSDCIRAATSRFRFPILLMLPLAANLAAKRV